MCIIGRDFDGYISHFHCQRQNEFVWMVWREGISLVSMFYQIASGWTFGRVPLTWIRIVKAQTDVPVIVAVHREASGDPTTCLIELLATGAQPAVEGHTGTAEQIHRMLDICFACQLILWLYLFMLLTFLCAEVRIIWFAGTFLSFSVCSSLFLTLKNNSSFLLHFVTFLSPL